MVEATPDDMWTPFKHLFNSIEGFLVSSGVQQQEQNVANLDALLRKHKQNFSTLLRNPPKNAKSREAIRQGITEGITLPEFGHTILSKDLVDESVILSDMYDLNEYIALELLCTAQQQMPNHPGLPRGLVAVLLYYDGRKSLVASLKELFQARAGVSWCTDAPQEITQLITGYTDGLVAEGGILDKIVDLLGELDVTKELDVLTTNRALGPPKHHRQVLDLFEEIRLLLATCLFNWAAQCGLPRATTLKLIRHLAKYKSTESSGGIDNVTLALQMALMYGLDMSVIQRREDGEDVVKKLPMVRDPELIETVMEALTANWECEGLRSVSLFTFGLAIATLRLAPQNLYSNTARIIDQDELLVDAAIQGKVFDFIHYTLLENEIIFRTEFYYRRMHVLFTDFIELMHSKVTELRARADETARTVQAFQQQGLDPPANLCRNFEALLLSVGKLYSNDHMRLNLSLEYWGPMEVAANYQRASSRSVCLFKFIRLAGELLPPILFIPYLKMLAGLSSSPQSARNSFNLLKQGGGGAIGGASATISWDHFFNSLFRYYQNLRQEQNPGCETVYRSRALSRNINPQEIAGLQAVLQVIRSVATHDEVARVALCEHPNWAPLHVLLGLISCSVPIALKAELVQTLAALGKSKETALQLWNNLEASQVITTIPTTSTFVNRGIESELEEIESRNETYPLTLGMLDLLYTLCETAIPKGLGAGPRKPGLDPYVTFIIDAVFLRFYNRNYKNPAEKWQIAEKCLQLLHAFAKNYSPSAADFPSTGGMALREENSPPGFHILLQVNTKSDFLRLLLHIIDESCALFDSFAPFAGRKHLEATSLYALQILERALETQEDFFNAHFSANCSILLAGANKLLLGMNPRSGKADHMLNITRFVTYNGWLPENALVAIRILAAIMRQPNVNQQILGLLTQNDRIKNEIRQGFVECLESERISESSQDAAENQGDLDGEGADGGDYQRQLGNSGSVELQIKEAIIGLLQDCLPQQSTPNLAHYLLGFELNKELRLTNLQQPGVMNFPSNCAKSLITLLDAALETSKSGKSSSPSQERLVENAYSLLYNLCYNSRTSEVILRFLRSCNDFLCRHIQGLPFANVRSAHVLNQMTGLLKCVAIELKLTSDKSQVSQFGNICKILLGVVQQHQQAHGQETEVSHHYSATINGSMLSTSLAIGESGKAGQQKATESAKLLLCQLLDCLHFEIKSLEKPKWDYFDNSLLAGLLQSCEVPVGTGGGLKLIDIKKLHDVLKDELNSVQTTIAAGQRAHILAEIETILMYALQVNGQRNLCASTVRFLEAWGQVTEVLFSVTPAMFVSLDVKQGLLVEIVQAVLSKVVPNQTMPELANLASSTVLLLMVNLRHCYALKNSPNPSDQSSLQSFFGGGPQQQVVGSFQPKTNTLSLRYILQNILEWILISGVGSQKLRINLYAVLLNYMHIVKGNRDQSEKEQAEVRADEFYVSRLDKSLTTVVATKTHDAHSADESHAQIEMVIEIFQSFGDKLIDILCHDCTGGHDICKMLALSCIDMLLDMDSLASVIQFISKRGYLAHLIDSLLKSDGRLCRILDKQPENMKALYVYESKMAMLSRIGSSHIGAELLLEEKALSVLAGMKVFDLHPDFQVVTYSSHYPQSSSFIPPIDARYRQVLFPALNLCDVILSTLGQENHSAVTQIIHFLLSHGDTIEIVLRAGTPFLDIGLLQELAGITSLIARAANQEIYNLITPNANQDLRAHLHRLQKLMLTLFPRFTLSEQTLKELHQNTLANCSEREKSAHLRYLLQIAANLALYARNSISNHSVDHRTISVLFSPQIGDGHGGGHGSGVLSHQETTSYSLNVVVVQLKHSVEYYNRERLTFEGLQRQRNSLNSLSLDANAQIQQSNLSERIASKQEELKRCVFITEHCLYLLWAHLDFFMLRAIPVNTLHLNMSYGTDNYLSSQTEVGWKITAEDVAVLKKTLIGVFNETFCKLLLTTAQDHVRASDKGFIEALLRRIKRLIQFVPVK